MSISDKLDANLPKEAVRSHPHSGMDYVEGWWVIDQLNHIFGWDGWSFDIIKMDQVWEGTNAKGTFGVTYYCVCRISTAHGYRFGASTGSGFSRTAADAYDSAIKSAETNALKRAAVKFGRYLGLALYDKEKAFVGDVIEPVRADVPHTKTGGSAPNWKVTAVDKVDFITQLGTKLHNAPTDGFLARVWSDNEKGLAVLKGEDGQAYAELEELYEMQKSKLKGKGLFK